MWIKIKGGLLNTQMVRKFALDPVTGGGEVMVYAEFAAGDDVIIAGSVTRDRANAILAQLSELVGVPKSDPAPVPPATVPPAAAARPDTPDEVSPAEALRLVNVLWGRISDDVKPEWAQYLFENYGTPHLGEINSEDLGTLYNELYAALKDAGMAPAPGKAAEPVKAAVPVKAAEPGKKGQAAANPP